MEEMTYMFFHLNDLIKTIKQSGHIVIYGAGHYAGLLYDFIGWIGEGDKVGCFTQTRIDGEKRFRDKPVFEFNKLNYREIDLLVVAVSNQYKDEIKNSISDVNLNNVIYLADLYHEYLSDEKLLSLYSSLTERDYVDCIYGTHYFSSADKYVEYDPNQICYEKKHRIKREKYVCFTVGSNVNARFTRIVTALKKIGYEITVLQLAAYDHFKYVGEENLIEQSIDFRTFETAEELIYTALQINPEIYYLEAPDSQATLTTLILFHKELFGKTVFSSYDINLGTYIGLADYLYNSEIYALEHADGVVWRYFSKDAIEKNYKVKYRGRTIQFFDGCDAIELSDNRDTSKLMLCSLPTHIEQMLGEFSSAAPRKIATISQIMDLIGNRNDVEFHVYVWSANEEQKWQLNLLQGIYPQFKVFYHVSNSELLKRLQEYDYMLSLSTTDTAPIMEIRDGKMFGYTNDVNKYGMSNKYFEAISAGVPIIATFGEVQCDILSEAGALLKKTVEEIDIDDLFRNRETYRQSTLKAREKLLINKTIHLLEGFFEEVKAG